MTQSTAVRAAARENTVDREKWWIKQLRDWKMHRYRASACYASERDIVLPNYNYCVRLSVCLSVSSSVPLW